MRSGRGYVMVALMTLLMAGTGSAALALSAGPSTGSSSVAAGEVVHHVRQAGPAGVQGVNAPDTGEVIPAGMLAAGAPSPLPPQVIHVSNAWQTSDGAQLVVVYAGGAGDNATNGRFVIVRQSEPAGTQTVNVVDVPATGPVSIINAPTAVTDPTQAELPYRTAAGALGVLRLGDDTATTG